LRKQKNIVEKHDDIATI